VSTSPPPNLGIKTVGQLHNYLYAAIQLEHATLPPYLTALYSLRPGTNSDAYHILRVVAVEEMLHLTLAANLLNAVGGTPDLTGPDFVPGYPACLPSGANDFTVSRERFSKDCVKTFQKIERPRRAPNEQSRLIPVLLPSALSTSSALSTPSTLSMASALSTSSARLLAVAPLAVTSDAVAPGEPGARDEPGAREEPGWRYYSIGEFYAEIDRGFRYLNRTMGDRLFSGDPANQVGKEHFYSGGGKLIPVTDLESAKEAIRIISEQGEGYSEGIYNAEGELSHYYRFQQLLLGRYYQDGDKPYQPDDSEDLVDPGFTVGAETGPSGPVLHVDWDSVYPIKKNAVLDDYHRAPELDKAACAFDTAYKAFLGRLTEAFKGQPNLMLEAVPDMFRLRDLMTQLIHNPIPGSNENAAPTFFQEQGVPEEMALVNAVSS
jgi:hypothetical protein